MLNIPTVSNLQADTPRRIAAIAASEQVVAFFRVHFLNVNSNRQKPTEPLPNSKQESQSLSLVRIGLHHPDREINKEIQPSFEKSGSLLSLCRNLFSFNERAIALLLRDGRVSRP